MFDERNQIIYIPYPANVDKSNAAQIRLVSILKRKYQVSGDLVKFANIWDVMKIKAIVLNWVEEYLDFNMKLMLWMYQMFGAKVIWVFHNKFPHDVSPDNIRVINNMKWLSNNSDIIWLFSKNSKKYIPNKRKNGRKSFYIPHIIYENHTNDINLSDIRKKYGILESDFVFLIFGLIRPYKNIERGIEVFTRLRLPNSKLIIAGNPSDVGYARSIKHLCSNNKDIILDLRYISNYLLDGIIGISDVIVLPYQDKSSMNSGVMIQAFSNGKTVISPDLCMARDFAKERFFYRYRDSLENAMKRAYKNGKEVNKKMGKQAQNYVEQKHNEKIVSKLLLSMLD